MWIVALLCGVLCPAEAGCLDRFSYDTDAQVKEEVRCETGGNIKMRAIAFPIATYRVIDLQENAVFNERDNRAKCPNLKIEVDMDAMTADGRREAIGLLQDTVDELSESRTVNQRIRPGARCEHAVPGQVDGVYTMADLIVSAGL